MKKRKGLWSLLILLVLVAGTFYYLLKDHELKKIAQLSGNMQWAFIWVGLALMLLYIACEALGIRVILGSLQYPHSYLKCLKYAFLGFYYCSIMPANAGQPVQIYYMTKDDVQVGDASLCIMFIIFAYQVGIFLISVFALAARLGFVLENMGPVKYFALFGAVVNVFLIALYAAAMLYGSFLKKAAAWFIPYLGKIHILKKPEKALEKTLAQLDNFSRGAEYLKTHRGVLLAVLGIILIKVLSKMCVAYAVYRAFGLSGYSFWDILALQAFLTLGVQYLPIPGSVGVAEAGFYRVNRMVFGADRLASATLLTRAISFYAFLVISGVVAIAVYLRQNLKAPRKRGA